MSSPALSLSPQAELKRILLATDLSVSVDSLAALPYVREIAAKFSSSVFLWHSVCSQENGSGASPIDVHELERQAHQKLVSLSHTVQFHSLDVSSLVANGPIAAQLPRAIRQNSVDLVVARTSGRRGLQRILYGSIVEEICRVATCPVLTVGPYLLPRREIRFRRIIVPTDLSQHSLRVIPAVASLASRYGATVTVLHVLPQGWETRMDFDRVQETARRVMALGFEPLRGHANVELISETGDVVETILRCAQRNNADLIAMGVNNAFEPGIQMCPSVASRVVSEAHCPVLTSR